MSMVTKIMYYSTWTFFDYDPYNHQSKVCNTTQLGKFAEECIARQQTMGISRFEYPAIPNHETILQRMPTGTDAITARGPEMRYEITMRDTVEITPVCIEAYHMTIEYLKANLPVAHSRNFRTITSMMHQDGQTADVMCMNYWLMWHSYHLPRIPLTVNEIVRYIAFAELQLLSRPAPPEKPEILHNVNFASSFCPIPRDIVPDREMLPLPNSNLSTEFPDVIKCHKVEQHDRMLAIASY